MRPLLKNILPGFYGLGTYFTIRLLQDTESGFHFWRRPLHVTLTEMGTSIVVGYVLILGINKILKNADKQPQNATAVQAFLNRELGYIIAFVVVVVNAVLVPLTMFTDDGMSLNDFVVINTIPLFYNIIYYGILRSRTYLSAYVQNQLLVERLTNDKLETELKFLKAQYHPHFLFNALNTIYFQMDEDVASAKTSVEKLSELLRYQLYDQQQKVSIGQELQYLKSFIELQKVRSSDRLKLKLDINDKLTTQLIYPLLFLPLVENAFKYAGGEYIINIAASLDKERFIFEVINSLPANLPLPKKSGGIGLENLKRRLGLLYPGTHQLMIDKNTDTFKATLILDLDHEK